MLNLKIYKLIGEINSAVSKSKNADEALKKSLKLIVDSGNSDYAVLWYLDKNDNLIHPYYWLCPYDLSTLAISKEHQYLWEPFLKKETAVFNDIEEQDKKFYKLLQNLKINSAVLVPFSFKKDTEGLITICKKEGNFTDEETDVYNILILLVETLIKDRFVDAQWTNKNKIMSVKGVTKEFVNAGIVTKVLKGINFDIFEGEFLCLLGESGCGKSTLLNILGGMDKPTSGEVYFMDKNIAESSEKELTEYRRNNVGFIFQSYNLMPNLTAKENLDLIGELVEEPLDSVETLSLVSLEDKKNNYPSQLSGGQQQRVSIARALIKNPKIIMADEPTAALDYETSIEVLTALENILKKKTTLVMVTHNEEIAKMADRVVRFRDGKIYEITVNNKKLKATELVW